MSNLSGSLSAMVLIGNLISSSKDYVSFSLENEYNKSELIKEGRSDDEMKFQELSVDLENLNFKLVNSSEIKQYLFNHRDLFVRLRQICEKTKEIFSEINKFYLVMNVDREDPTFKSIILYMPVKEFTEEREDRISNFILSKTFNFLQNSDSFFFIFQENINVLRLE